MRRNQANIGFKLQNIGKHLQIRKIWISHKRQNEGTEWNVLGWYLPNKCRSWVQKINLSFLGNMWDLIFKNIYEINKNKSVKVRIHFALYFKDLYFIVTSPHMSYLSKGNVLSWCSLLTILKLLVCVDLFIFYLFWFDHLLIWFYLSLDCL